MSKKKILLTLSRIITKDSTRWNGFKQAQRAFVGSSPPHEEDPPFMWQVQVLLSCLIQGRSAKFWGRSKAILPQSGVAIICKRPQDRIRLFDPTNAPRPPLPCPASCPPICFPQFPSHPSSPQFVNFRLEGTRRRRNNRGSSGTYWEEGHLAGVAGRRVGVSPCNNVTSASSDM